MEFTTTPRILTNQLGIIDEEYDIIITSSELRSDVNVTNATKHICPSFNEDVSPRITVVSETLNTPYAMSLANLFFSYYVSLFLSVFLTVFLSLSL